MSSNDDKQPIFCVSLGTSEYPLDIIGQSAYVYLLIPGGVGRLLFVLIYAFQVALLVFLAYEVDDSRDEIFVSDFPEWVGYMSAAFLLSLRTLPHIGQGLELMLRPWWKCKETDNKCRYNADNIFQAFSLFVVGFAMF